MLMREILLFMSGMAVGTIVAMRIVDKKYSDKFEDEVNRRIDEIHANEIQKRKDEERENLETVKKEKVQYNHIARDYQKEERKEAKVKEDYKEETVDESEYEHPEDDDEKNPYPYEISEDDWDEDGATHQWDQSELYFYRGNQTLVDDVDNVLEDDEGDISMMLGDHWMEKLLKHERGVLYVRNEKLDTDYEITINDGDFPLEIPLS